MATSKCSGQTIEKDSDNSRARCTRAKVKDEKVHPASGSPTTSNSRSRNTPEKTTESKRSSSSASVGVGSPNPRRSEDAPTTRSSSLGTRKSQRLEKSTPTESPVKNHTEKVALASTLRKSERIEKRACSTPPSSKMTSPEDKKRSLDSRENGNQDTGAGSVLKKRKPCDARAFRAIFTPANKKAVHRSSVQADKDGVETAVGGDASSSDMDRVANNFTDSSREKYSSHTGERSARRGTATVQSDEEKGVGKIDTQDSDENINAYSRKEQDFTSDCTNDRKKDKKVLPRCNGEEIRGEFDREVSNTEILTLVKKEVEISEGIKKNPVGDVSKVCPNFGTNFSSPSEAEKFKETCSEDPERNGSSVAIPESANEAGSCETCSLNTFVCKNEQDNIDPDTETWEQSTTQRKGVAKTSLREITDVSSPVEEDRRTISTCNGRVGENDGTEQEELFPLDNATRTDNNICVICKHPGELLCCDGKDCKRIYHLYCLDPPLKEVPAGLWHCLYCVRKKLVSGVYSVSEGIEDILDVNVDDISSSDAHDEKLYLVKYEGLSHVHNRWVPESEIAINAPMLFTKFQTNQKDKVSHWKKEWTTPHRLLGKRLIMPLELADECFRQYAAVEPCYYEWFVKWTGLSYEQATWEFENSAFFNSPDSSKLINNYEMYRAEAKELSHPARATKVQEMRKKPFCMLSGLPDGFPDGLDSGCLNSINRLREFWYKEENAVFANEQDHIIKVTLLVLSLLPDVCHPVLLITTSDSLHLWEAELMRLMPSANVVIYSGSKEERKIIHKFEFYEEGGCILFRVLLSHIDVIVEDFDILDRINWEAIVVDNCHVPKVLKSLEQLKKLPAEWRLLLLNGPMKDNVPQYLNLLSFLDSGRKGKPPAAAAAVTVTNLASDLAVLKEQLAKYYVKERRQDPSRFVEFWVPVQLSNVQLEHYCATLDSGAMILKSSSKVDPVGALRELVLSVRKCCEHPYLVDGSLQGLLTKCVPANEILDVGVNASGKLRLLDRILQDMQSRGLRAIILFQFVGGEGKISIGDILDDFLRQRFSADAYERVDSGLTMTKKQAALQNFNNKERGRFVFLIENRACLPSIKLSSVDAVIIYGSDWNPLNDIKALQKISIKSHRGQLKVLRLYTVFTVEEMVLSLAKQNTTLDSNITNITPSVSHSLLRWGAHLLFQKLAEFHKCDSQSTISVKSVFEKPVLHDVLLELKSIFDDSGTDVSFSFSTISEVQPGVAYSSSILLFGEKELKATDDDASHVFWSKLLDGRPKHWRYQTSLSQRARRKTQHIVEPHLHIKDDLDEAKKKLRKAGSLSETVVCHPGLQSDRQETGALSDNNDISQKHISNDTSKVVRVENADHGGGRARNSQKDLLLVLKPELGVLSVVLGVSEDVKGLAETLLEYVMNNLHVSQDQQTLLQAFKISLCWRAASLLKCKMDHKESLALARKHLNYDCKDDEAESVYAKLRTLPKKLPQLGNMKTNSLAAAAEHEVEKNVGTAVSTCSEQSARNDMTIFSGTTTDKLPDNACLLKEPLIPKTLDRNDNSKCLQTPGIDTYKCKASSPICQVSETTNAPLLDRLNCEPVHSLADAASVPRTSDCVSETNNGLIKGTTVPSCYYSSTDQNAPSVMDTFAQQAPDPDIIRNSQLLHLDSIITSTPGDPSHVGSQSKEPHVVASSTDSNPGQLQHPAADVLLTDYMDTTEVRLNMPHPSVVPATHTADVSGSHSGRNAACSENDSLQVTTSSLPNSSDHPNTAFMSLETVPASLTGTHDCTQLAVPTSQSPGVPTLPAAQGAGILENSDSLSLARSVCSRLLQPTQVYARLPNQGLHADPLQNELLRISIEKESLAHLHNDLRQKLVCEYEAELEKLKMKYEASLHEVELVFSEKTNALDIIYKKVDVNRVLAEEFRSKFTDSRSTTTRPANLQVPSQLSFRPQHVPHDQLPQRAFTVPSTTVAPVGVPSVIAPPFSSTDVSYPNSCSGSFVNNDDLTCRLTTQPMAVQPTSTAPSMPHQVVHQASALFSAPASRPYVSSAPAVRGTHRSPAPHLHTFRPLRVPHPASQHSQSSNLQRSPDNSGVATFVPLHISTPVSSLASQNPAIRREQDESAVIATECGQQNVCSEPQTDAPILAEIAQSQTLTEVLTLPTFAEQGQPSLRCSSDVLLEDGSSSPVLSTAGVQTDSLCKPPPEK